MIPRFVAFHDEHEAAFFLIFFRIYAYLNSSYFCLTITLNSALATAAKVPTLSGQWSLSSDESTLTFTGTAFPSTSSVSPNAQSIGSASIIELSATTLRLLVTFGSDKLVLNDFSWSRNCNGLQRKV
jgi:hypothetical protein